MSLPQSPCGPQEAPPSDGIVQGTPEYTAPEVLLAAGVTADQLRRLAAQAPAGEDERACPGTADAPAPTTVTRLVRFR